MRLAGHLRYLRGDTPAADVAQAMHWSLSKLNRIENNKVTIQPLEVQALVGHYGVDDPEEVDRLVQLSLASRQRMWWRDRHVPDDYLTFVAFENDASHLYGYQATYLPPLLQSRDYAVALTASVLRRSVNDSEVQNIVDVRMKRQEILMERLTREHPPRLSQAIDEAVLLRPIGGDKVMSAQLDHLLEMNRRPTVDLTVLPFRLGAHPGLGGTFELLTFSEDDDLDVVFIETPGTDFLLTDAENTITFRSIMQDLLSSDTSGDSLEHAVHRARRQLHRQR
jgi:hypothetical protein